MPSSHSQFMSFFAVYLALAVLRSFHGWPKWQANGIIAWAAISTALVAYSRYVHLSAFIKKLPHPLLTLLTLSYPTSSARWYLVYHTLAQVLVGLAIGAVAGAAWFYVVDPLLDRLGVFTSPLARALLVRDYRPIPNVVQFEYENAVRAAAAAADAKSK